MGDIVGGTFTQHFDKKGNPTTTDDTVLGVTYHDTQQQFAERLQAENYVAVLDKMGIAASAFVDGMRGDADKLMQAVQDLASATQSAQQDITKGFGLLGKDSNIADVIAEVIKLNNGSEALAQTYARLEQQTQTMLQTFKAMNIDLGIVGAAFVEFTDDMVKAAGSLQNLQALWDSYFKNYYSAAEQTGITLSNLAQNAKDDLTSIGLSADTTMAQFRSAFEAEQAKDAAAVAAGTMTAQQAADDIVNWLKAGDALAKFTSAVNQVADAAAQAQANYDQFMAPFRMATDGLDDFEHAMLGLGATLQQNIAHANALAQAAGMQGASAEDIAKIIEVAAKQGAAAIQQLQQNAQQLASQLYGQDYISGLQAKLDAAMKAQEYIVAGQLRKQIQAAQGSQQQQVDNSRYLSATQLAQDIGEIAAAGGGSLTDVLKNLGIPLDAFAKDLHLQGSALQDYLQGLEDQASAALKSANNSEFMKEYLQDIRDILEGKPISWDGSQQQLGPGGKIGIPGFHAPGSTSNDLYIQNPPQTNRGGTRTAGVLFTTGQGAPQPGTAPQPDVTNAVDNNTDAVTRELRAIREELGEHRRLIGRYGLARGVPERV
jgi:hypothetical protein